MVVKLISAEKIVSAFNTLSTPSVARKEASKSFSTLARAAKQDPDAVFENLGQLIKTKTVEQIQAAGKNIQNLHFSKLRLIFTGLGVDRKARKVHPTQEEYNSSAKVIQKKYPELMNFLYNLWDVKKKA